jgi:ferrochelatase
MQNREFFLEAGGQQFDYIPALNDSTEHIDMLSNLVQTHCQGWQEENEDMNLRKERAIKIGATN